MKLLIITQKIDRDDDLLGFFHGWIEKLAEKFEFIHVICLEQGKTVLPTNVKVWSLGKERGVSRLKYIINFYRYIWRLRQDYSTVFIHMNKEYAILGGPLWHLWDKKMVLWYNHKTGNGVSRLAGYLAKIILCTSPFSFFANWKKTQLMPAGIDTYLFKIETVVKPEHSLLCLGRIDPIKNIDVLVSTTGMLEKHNQHFTLDIYGNPTKADNLYYLQLKKDIVKSDKVNFHGSIANYLTPQLYNKHELYINLTNSGSLDKTILEAMACGSLVLVSNKTFQKILPPLFLFEERSVNDLAVKIEKIWQLSEVYKKEYGQNFRQYVIKEHSLSALIQKLLVVFN